MPLKSYNKLALTFDLQLDKLIARGLLVDKREQALKALIILVRSVNDLKKQKLMSLDQKNFMMRDREKEENPEEEMQYSYLSMVAGMTYQYLRFEKDIQAYEEQFERVLSKTEHYIKLLGISPPIQVFRDENGKPIYSKLGNA